MFEFEVKPIHSLSESETHHFSRTFSHLPMGAIALEWSTYIQETAVNPVDIHVLTITRRGAFRGIAILQIVRNVNLLNHLPTPFKKFFGVFKAGRWNLLAFDFGILDIPLMHRPGLLTVANVSSSEYAEILVAIARYFRKNRLGMHVLCVNTDPTCHADHLLAEEGLVARPSQGRTILEYPYKSFDEYYATLSRSTRKDLRRNKNLFQRYNGRIELCKTPETVADEVTTLFHNTAHSKSGIRLIEIDTPLFARLDRFNKGSPQLLLVRVEDRKIVAFFLLFQSKDTLFLKFCGLDYDLSLKMRAYFNLFYAAMEYAIRQNLTKIDCGITNNYFKEKRLNCQLTPVTYWLDFYHPFFWPITWFKRMVFLFKPPGNVC